MTQTLRLLSWNIQCGIQTDSHHEYVTRGWRHLLPHRASPSNLRRIAGLMTAFDVVAIQEADGGSLRSGFLNQVEYLADMAGFPYWHGQRTRNLAQFGQHGNGLLSRFRIQHIHEHRLPGLIPGRGAIQMQLGEETTESITLVAMHLSLGKRSRLQQLKFLAKSLQSHKYIVLMGDTNCEAEEIKSCFADAGHPMRGLPESAATFPSWKPNRQLDHILAGENLIIDAVEVLPYCYSDHLPVAMEIRVPSEVQVGESGHRSPLAPAAVKYRNM